LEGSPVVVTEAVPLVINPNDTVEFTFSVPMNLMTTVDTIYKLRAWIDLAGDPVPENDSTGWQNVSSNVSPAPPQVANVTISQGDSATLHILNPDTNMTYKWYDVPVGGTELVENDTFITPPLYQTTVYYVESSTGSALYNIGMPDPSLGASSSYTSSNHYLLIDVLSPQGITIVSTDIYPTAAVGSAFQVVLQNSASTVIGTYSGITTVSSGPQTIYPNFYLPPGTGYRLGMGTPNPGVLRNSTGGAYPYTVPNIATITGNTFDATYYYFHYNIFITEGAGGGAGNGCPSPRAADTVFVTSPIIAVNAGNDTSMCAGTNVQLNVTASGGTGVYTYAWSPAGSLSSATIANPIASPVTNTTYSVTVT
ncbi:MAG: hypothetical protein IH599_01780, partial [Bacteroidales bacterium]|nr:hypothetical protein [Bacteroidales bacterium]